MKSRTKKLLLVMLSLILVFSCLSIVAGADDSDIQTAETDKKINVWLIAGQSNAVGYGKIENYPDGYSDKGIIDAGIQNVLYYGKGYGNDITNFVPVTFGLGQNATYSGAEIGIATALGESGEQHVIIKYGSGDTQLSAAKVTAENNVSTWTPPSYIEANPSIAFEGDKIGDLYDGFISTVEEAVTKLKAEGYTPVIQGLWWMQGERDSNLGEMTKELYSKLLKTLISDVRRDVGTIVGEDLSDMPVVFGRVYRNPDYAPLSAAGLAAVQAAQDAVAYDKTLKNVAMLDTRYDLIDPASSEAKNLVQQDGWHYDSLTQQMIGEAFVKKTYALKNTQDGTDKSVYIEGYGTIPEDRADANTYPIALFQNGELKGVYGKTDFRAAYKAAHDLTTSSGAPAAKILLRGNAEFAGTAYADKVGSSFSEIDINLGGYTLTHTGSNFVFYLRMLSHTTKGETFTLNIRNGNMITNYVMFGVGAMYEGDDTSVLLTNVDINMTDVNVKVNAKGWNTGPIFYNQGNTNKAEDKEISFDLTMTDCILDFTDLTKSNAIFDTTSSHVASDGSKIHAFNIEINGGELIVGKGNNDGTNPYNASLYTLNAYSSISFGKGSDGEYLKLTVPSGVSASVLTKTALYTDKSITVAGSDGVEAEFINPVTVDDWITYSLQSDVHIKDYGTIPKEYSNSNTYPIVLFQGGEFKGAYLGNEFREVLIAARKLVDYNKAGAAKAQILLRGNATMTEKDDQNMGRAIGEIEIDLNGFTLTQTHTDYLFLVWVKDYSATKDTFTLTVKNGTVLLNGVMFGFGVQSGIADSELNDAKVNMENVNVVLKSTATPNAGPIFGAVNGGNGNTSGDTDVHCDVKFTNCHFDLSNLGKANYIFNASLTSYNSKETAILAYVGLNVEINGGKLIVGKGNDSGINPYNASLYTLNTYSSISFGKGSDGNYLKITVPKDVTAPIVNGKVTLDTGVECVFVKSSAEGANTTYQVYPEVMLGYKIKTSVTLYSNFVYNVYVPKNADVLGISINGVALSDTDFVVTDATVGSEEYYKIAIPLAVSESLSEIDVKVTLKSGVTSVDASWSVGLLGYAKRVIEGNYSEAEKTLAKDMLSYAKAAYVYADSVDKESVITKVDEILDDYINVFTKVDGETNVNTGIYCVKFILAENPIIRFYLAKDMTKESYTFKYGNTVLEYISEGSETIDNVTYNYVDISLYAYQLIGEITYTDGTNNGSYHINSYYDFVTTDIAYKDNIGLITLVEKLYNYCKSAAAYREYAINNHEHSFNSTVKEEATAFTRGSVEHKCSSCGYTYTEVIPTTLKILAVGNSFSVDAMQHLYLVAKDAGIENVVLGNLYIGSCSIATHLTKMKSNAADYTFYISDDASGNMVIEGTRSAKYGITYDDWDYITIQQASGSSGLSGTFADLQSVIDYINSNKTSDAEILWHMTWAYQQNSTHSGFANYNNNQTTMYSSIVSVVNELILSNSDISGVIPSGTAIQNLRTSPLGDTLTRDGYHLSYGIGRYTAALTWLAAITGYDIDKITATPTSYPEVAENLDYIKEAVNNAIENPYEVTASVYTSTAVAALLSDDEE